MSNTPDGNEDIIGRFIRDELPIPNSTGKNTPREIREEELDVWQEMKAVSQEICEDIQDVINASAPSSHESHLQDIEFAESIISDPDRPSIRREPRKLSSESEYAEMLQSLVNAFAILSDEPTGPIARTFNRLQQIMSAELSRVSDQTPALANLDPEAFFREVTNEMMMNMNYVNLAAIFISVGDDLEYSNIGSEWPGLMYNEEEFMFYQLWRVMRRYCEDALTAVLTKYEMAQRYGTQEEAKPTTADATTNKPESELVAEPKLKKHPLDFIKLQFLGEWWKKLSGKKLPK